MKIWWKLRFWNNPAVPNYPGNLVKKTGVRTLTVLHNHDNRESPFHRQTRSKSWPWQKALVPTVSFNTEFYGRRDTQSWGLCISLHRQPLLYGYTLESDPTRWSRLSIVLEQRNRTRTIPQRRPFRTILCLNHQTLICTYVHSIINGSWVIACIRFYWTKFRVTVVTSYA